VTNRSDSHKARERPGFERPPASHAEARLARLRRLLSRVSCAVCEGISPVDDFPCRPATGARVATRRNAGGVNRDDDWHGSRL
jgi:hypothetical protein